MQGITILGLALCLAVIYLRARSVRTAAPSTVKQRFKTGHFLLAALLAWLVISLQLQHLNHALSGEEHGERSTWERVVRTVADWL